MPRRGKRRQKTRTHVIDDEVEEEKAREAKIPRTFVVKKGNVGPNVTTLMHDIRDVMMPYTARKLRERKGQRVKDFVHIAGPLGVSHLTILTSTKEFTNMRVSRMPRGPTLTFQILEYSLAKMVRASQKRPIDATKLSHDPPLVVLNNFNDQDNHVKLASATFQSMFPRINVQTAQPEKCKRVVLLDYDAKSETIEYRHYAISTAATGDNRAVRRLVRKKIPNLGRARDISEYLTEPLGAGGSDSEAEEETVTVPTARRPRKGQKCGLKLTEIGPRMKVRSVG